MALIYGAFNAIKEGVKAPLLIVKTMA